MRLETERLVLRPFHLADVPAVLAIQSDWSVTRNLRLADWPPTSGSITAFLAGHEAERQAGTAHRFAVTESGRVIGCADLDEIAGGCGELGYWLERAAWGRGLATEAAAALVAFARDFGLVRLATGHAADNPASGKVLAKLGFRHRDDVVRWSKPRDHWIVQRRYQLTFQGVLDHRDQPGDILRP